MTGRTSPRKHRPLAVVDVDTASACTCPVDELVSRLEEHGRPVLRWTVTVSDAAVTGWLGGVAAQIRAQLLSSTVDPAPATVHAFGWRALLAVAAARGPAGPAVVAHLGDGPPVAGPADLPGCRLERLVWATARTVEYVVLESEWAIDRATAAGLPRARILRGLPMVSTERPDVPWSIRDAGHTPRLVAVGGVGPTAGTDVLLQAVGRMQDVELVVAAPAGASRPTLNEARRWLKRLTPRRGARVSCAPFSPELLEDCDAVLDAGTVAGSASGVLAAMAHRRAVIASDVGPRAEAVVPGTTGEVLPPGDWRQWGEHILKLLRDPFRLEAYGDAGFERSRVGFTSARRAGMVLGLDERLAPLTASAATLAA